MKLTVLGRIPTNDKILLDVQDRELRDWLKETVLRHSTISIVDMTTIPSGKWNFKKYPETMKYINGNESIKVIGGIIACEYGNGIIIDPAYAYDFIRLPAGFFHYIGYIIRRIIGTIFGKRVALFLDGMFAKLMISNAGKITSIYKSNITYYMDGSGGKYEIVPYSTGEKACLYVNLGFITANSKAYLTIDTDFRTLTRHAVREKERLDIARKLLLPGDIVVMSNHSDSECEIGCVYNGRWKDQYWFESNYRIRNYKLWWLMSFMLRIAIYRPHESISIDTLEGLDSDQVLFEHAHRSELVFTSNSMVSYSVHMAGIELSPYI